MRSSIARAACTLRFSIAASSNSQFRAKKSEPGAVGRVQVDENRTQVRELFAKGIIMED
jgi:hypothetical protein